MLKPQFDQSINPSSPAPSHSGEQLSGILNMNCEQVWERVLFIKDQIKQCETKEQRGILNNEFRKILELAPEKIVADCFVYFALAASCGISRQYFLQRLEQCGFKDIKNLYVVYRYICLTRATYSKNIEQIMNLLILNIKEILSKISESDLTIFCESLNTSDKADRGFMRLLKD